MAAFLETLAHLLLLFCLPIFPRFSIGLARELHGEILREGWMLRRQARPCTNLSWLYRRFGVVNLLGLFGAFRCFRFSDDSADLGVFSPGFL
jgi:hypothetical protein